MGFDMNKFGKTNFPIKSSYRYKPEIDEESEYNDSFWEESEDTSLNKSNTVINGFKIKSQEKKSHNISPKNSFNANKPDDYIDLLKTHCRRRQPNRKRISSLAQPRQLPLIDSHVKRKGKTNFTVNKKLNLSWELASKYKEKVILYNSVKAHVYGVDIKDIPILDKNINNYEPTKTKSRILSISSQWIKKMKKKNMLKITKNNLEI